jgi:hypothetical protein
MIAKNIEDVLAQSRSRGMACILAHQAMSQLNSPGGVDLRELIDCDVFAVNHSTHAWGLT